MKLPYVCTCGDGGGETTKRSTGMATIREKETRQTQTYLGGGERDYRKKIGQIETIGEGR
jgi:hypothetical protein